MMIKKIFNLENLIILVLFASAFLTFYVHYLFAIGFIVGCYWDLINLEVNYLDK